MSAKSTPFEVITAPGKSSAKKNKASASKSTSSKSGSSRKNEGSNRKSATSSKASGKSGNSTKAAGNKRGGSKVKASVKGKKTSTRKKTSRKSGGGLKAWFADARTRKVAGLGFLLLATFLGVALTSYLFTHPTDHDKIQGRGFEVIFDGTVDVSNALGRLGAWVAHQLIFLRFGIAAFLIIGAAAITGANLLHGKRFVYLRKVYAYSLISLVWISSSMAFLFGANSDIMGGGLGRYIVDGLTGALGQTGTGLVLIFSLLVAATLLIDPKLSFSLPAFKLPKLRSAGADSAEAGMDEDGFDLVEDRERLAPTYASANEVNFKTVLPEEEPQSIEDHESKLQLELETAEAEAKNKFSGEEPRPSTPEKPATPKLQEPVGEEDLTTEPAMELELPETAAKKKKAPEPSTEDLSLDIVESKQEETKADRGSLESSFDPTLELSNYKFPKLELLEDYGSSEVRIDTMELERNKDRIIETLDDYGIRISKIKATVGPTVTLYEIVPSKGVRISKIKNLEDDIALSLAALGIRIIAPIPGKGTIGIEVPNVHKAIVGMRTMLGSEKFTDSDMDLPICLGKTISSENYVADLARMPHLLIAGATGQGKSVGINSLLVSLLYKKHPSELKFVLIDPKKVELSLFHQVTNHFLAKLPGEEEAIITDTRKVVQTLNALCIEMDERYDLLKKARARNIKEYNQKFLKRKLNPENGHKFLPFIVLVIDEFADLIMTAGKEIEMPIARLAQLARAIGIHLVIATQRPSVKIITGLIKANFPARIAFKVTAKVDSRTILDAGGADQLIGRGDMLLSIGSDVVRLQCPFVDTPEVERVADFIGAQKAPPEAYLLPEYIDEKDLKSGDLAEEDRDSLFEDAARLVVQHQQGSTSLIQRRLKLGYNRAGRLMDQLEAAGVVGPNQGSKAREVLVQSEMELEQFLNL